MSKHGKEGDNKEELVILDTDYSNNEEEGENSPLSAQLERRPKPKR